MPDNILDPKQREQLDSNIKMMLEKGASQDDVMSYASDFKNQFGKKKEPTIPSEPSSQQEPTFGTTNQIFGFPNYKEPEKPKIIEKKEPNFFEWEKAIGLNKVESERISTIGYVAGPGGQPYLPSDAQIKSINSAKQKAQFNLKNEESKNASEVEKITDQLTIGDNWKQFMSGDAADVSKLLNIASEESKKRGGGDGVKEIIYNSLLNKVEYNKIKPDVEKRYEEDVKKQTGKTPDEYIRDVMKSSPEMVNGIKNIQALKINYENKIKADQESTSTKLKQKGDIIFAEEFLPQLEEKAKLLGLTRSDKDPSKWIIPFKEGTQEYESVKKQWSDVVDKSNASYISKIRTLVTKENQRIGRVSSEFNRILNDKITDLNKDAKIPQSEIDKLNSFYSKAYTDVSNERSIARGAAQDIMSAVYGKGWLFRNSIGSSLFSTLASKGEMLISSGLNNGFTDWLRALKTPAEQMQVVSKPLDGKNLFNPDTYLTRVGNTIGSSLTSLVSGIAATAISGPATGAFVAGLSGFADETSSIGGDTYSQAISDGYSQEEASSKARKVMSENFALLPLYFLEGAGIVKQMKGLKGFATGTAMQAAGEVGTEVPQQYFQNVEIKGYAKTPLEYLKSEGKMVALDTLIGSIGQGSIMSTITEGINSFKRSISGSEKQMFINALNKKGMAFANAILESQYINGIIDKEELGKKKEDLRSLADSLGSLDELGLNDDQKKLYSGIRSEIDELKQKFVNTNDETIKSTLEEQIKIKEKDAKDILSGRDSYVKITSPTGIQYIATPEQAQQVFENPKNAKLIADDVVGFEFVNAEETKSLYEKAKENAITSSKGIVQEGVPEGGIVQPTRAEAQGQEAPAEANVGNRAISGEGQVAIPFEITTYIEGQHKEEYNAAVNRLIDQGNTPEQAAKIVVEEISNRLQQELPAMMKESGIESELVSVTSSEGGYTNTESGKYDLSPNIMISMSENSSEEDVDAVMKAANMTADQQSANAFMNASEEDIAANGDNIHNILFFEKPENMTNDDFAKMMFELHDIKDQDGNSFLTGHSDFGSNIIGIGGQFYGKNFANQVESNIDKINSIFEKYGIGLSSVDLTQKKVLTYDRSQTIGEQAEGQMENISGVSTKAQRLIQKTKDLYSGAIKTVGQVATKQAERINIDDFVQSAQKSLAESGVIIQVVDNEQDAIKTGGEAARGNQGIFISSEGQIVIDKSKLANSIEAGIVVWHEASHPIMNIIRNTNKPLYDKISSGLSDAASKNIAVKNALDWATQQYSDKGAAVVADEAIVEVIGRIGSGVIDPSTIDTGLRQSIIDFINKIAKALGFDQILDDTDMATFKRIASEVSNALKTGRPISEIVGKENVFEYGAPFNEQVQARIPDKYGAKIKAKESYSLSFVKPSDLIDIRLLIEDIANTGKKIWFWTADQLGRGQYYDKVINGEHYLDAGPSFALDPNNRNRGVIWATGKGENWINKNIQNSDYIFIISGSPLKSKMFNKRVAEITINRIQATADFNKFKSDILGVSKIKDLNNLLNDFNSFDELISSPKRKDFLNIIDDQKSKKGTPLKAILEKYNAFVDYNELRDGFYKDNGFDLNDIMLVLKPEKFGGKSEHSTYENDIIGSVVGVPDRIINAFDIMTDEVKSKYQRELSRTEQAQAVAPYGSGIREVSASKGGRTGITPTPQLSEEGKGKERERGLKRRMEGLTAEVQQKISDDAKTYFQKTNKQTKEAVDEFVKDKNSEDLVDFMLDNPSIPDSSLVWMAATVAKRMSKEIQEAKDSGDYVLAQKLSDSQARLYNEFAKKATDLGQAVQAFVAFADDPNAVRFSLNKIVKQLKEKNVDVTDEQITTIEDKLKKIGEAAEGIPKDMAIIDLGHYLSSITRVNPMDILQSVWYAKILSGISTQTKNTLANFFNTIAEVGVVSTREAIKDMSLMPYAMALKGLGSGIIKGSVVARDILKTGLTRQNSEKYFRDNVLETFSWGRTKVGQLGGGTVGKILDFPLFIGISPKSLRMVGRALSAMDAMFSMANQESFANMYAYSMALKEGKTDPTVNNFARANEILSNTKEKIESFKNQATKEGFKPGTDRHTRRMIELLSQSRGETINKESQKFGERATLNYDPEGFIKPIYDAIVHHQRNWPIIKLWIPFTRIVANISEQMINYSPAGLYKVATGKRNPLNKKSDSLSSDERADLAIKAMMGLTALGILSMKAGDEDDDWFEITASGTGNIQKNYELQKEGWRPYTITLKDGTKLNYQDWPIRGILAGVGHVRDNFKYNKDDLSSQSMLFALGFGSALYENSIMSGLVDFIDIFKPSRGRYVGEPVLNEEGEQIGVDRTSYVKDGITKWAAQQVKSVAVSNFTQQILKLADEMEGRPIKNAKGVEIIYREIPILNDGLRPIIDVFGDPVPPTTSEKILQVYKVDENTKDKLLKMLHDYGIFVGIPAKENLITISGKERPMNDDELYEYRLLSGKYTKELLYQLLDVNTKEGLDITQAKADAAISSARSRAYAEMLTKSFLK